MTSYTNKAPGVYIEHVLPSSAPMAGVGTSTAGFIGAMPSKIGSADIASKVKLVTNFTEFKAAFGGDFTQDPGQSRLAHAVYGFFNNGGTRCYVVNVPSSAADSSTVNIGPALEAFEAIDEIAIVAAPGLSSKDQYTALQLHCEKMGDRFAVLDSLETIDDFATALGKPTDPAAVSILPQKSDYSAFYFPWIQVYDPATKKSVYVPPSGHLAGIYARVDDRRGVHKAPANEPILGATGLKYAVSRSQQDGLNGHGVNCIRSMNGSIVVWGARTVLCAESDEFKYINIRRLYNFIRESIDKGTQWAVFEPNNPDLWAKISRSVTAFLTNVWHSGALFGSSPEEAFFVKCDAETNPPDLRELGQVVTEVGVAMTRPAEFVIFRLGQKAAS